MTSWNTLLSSNSKHTEHMLSGFSDCGTRGNRPLDHSRLATQYQSYYPLHRNPILLPQPRRYHKSKPAVQNPRDGQQYGSRIYFCGESRVRCLYIEGWNFRMLPTMWCCIVDILYIFIMASIFLMMSIRLPNTV
jgi:hypothetical protein